ncbi:hypothetical protein LG322_08465 [Microbacterium aerolatum]|uniref:hypothetical protein n=1 Tax=Microbacterium aerolatum TaxID=153731 RepID=UPI003850E678
MPITQELALEVVSAHQAAGRSIGSVDFVSTMWSERQAQDKLSELKYFMKKPEKTKAKNAAPEDGDRLSAMDFRDFVERFPRESLDGIPKYMVSSVGLVMSNHCTYDTGAKMQLTLKALADRSGVAYRGVVRVLALLESVGAITKTRGLPHLKGRPSTEYRFTRSDFVAKVLNDEPNSCQGTI